MKTNNLPECFIRFTFKLNNFLIFIYITALLGFSGCLKSEETLFLNSLDFAMIKSPNPPPTPNSVLFITLKINNNGQESEIITNNMTGKKIYEFHYKELFSNYSEFLRQNRNTNFKIKSINIDEVHIRSYIDKSDSIHTDYKQLDFDVFLKKYFIASETKNWEQSFRSTDEISIESEPSLISIMFRNNYYIVEDCVSGYFYYMKYRK